MMAAESSVSGFMLLRSDTPDSQHSRNGTEVARVLPDSSDDIRRTNMQSEQAAISSSYSEFGNTDRVEALSTSHGDGDVSHVDDGSSLQDQRHLQHSGEQPDCRSEIDDFVSSLGSFADSSIVSNLPEYLLQSDDPQLAELNQLITELEQLQDFNACSFQQANGAAPKKLPAEEAADINEVRTGSSSQTDQKTATNKDNDKVKSHPAIAALLMNGRVDPNEPLVPLKEKPFKHKGDMEGSILYLKNAEKTNTTLLSAASTARTAAGHSTTTASQLSVCDEAPNSTMPAASLPNVMLGHGRCVKSGNSGGNLSASASLLLRDADNVINQLREEYGTAESASSLDQQLSRNHSYWRVIEDKLRLTIAQNQRLANLNVQLQTENYQLKRELGYHKALLANQSAIADLIHKSSDGASFSWSTSTNNNQIVADEPDERVKRFKGLDGCRFVKFPPRGLCIHIDPGSKTDSVQLCQRCMNHANHF